MRRWIGIAAVVSAVMLGSNVASAAPPTHHRTTHRSSKKKKLAHAAGWAGAGAAASHFAGPPGSIAVGATKYRKDLAKNWHTRRRAMVKIGAPLAAGAIAGPVGTAGYEAYDHRKWIKRHILRKKPHRRRANRVRRRVGVR